MKWQISHCPENETAFVILKWNDLIVTDQHISASWWNNEISVIMWHSDWLRTEDPSSYQKCDLARMSLLNVTGKILPWIFFLFGFSSDDQNPTFVLSCTLLASRVLSSFIYSTLKHSSQFERKSRRSLSKSRNPFDNKVYNNRSQNLFFT